ncbi:MAG: 2-oxoacid:acceptor oxidoreductase family protein, partial [Bacteroidales bacterium]|nr:2-oxoacid:acceptor oxidoreductase family protein [Bacteroidales bacterium]
VLLYDTNGIIRHPTRKDINIYQVEASHLASEMGNAKIFNMIVLGAYLKIKPIVKMENVVLGLKESLPERYHKLIPLNEDAINSGLKNVVAFHELN